MRLSRLHIAGFKSFCDRAELGFDQGVTLHSDGDRLGGFARSESHRAAGGRVIRRSHGGTIHRGEIDRDSLRATPFWQSFSDELQNRERFGAEESRLFGLSCR